MPLRTAFMNCTGMFPPDTRLSIENPCPGSFGRTASITRAYMPTPPFCFLNRWSASARSRDRLAICDGGHSGEHRNAVILFELFADHFQVQFTQSPVRRQAEANRESTAWLVLRSSVGFEGKCAGREQLLYSWN